MTQNISQTPNTNDEQTFGYRQDNDTFFNALTINIEEPGTLEDLFHALNPKDMTGIRVVGPINATDIAFLAKLSAGNELDSLHSINLHDAFIERLPDHAFEGLVFLTHFYFPTQLKAVGDFAFANCNALLSIELPQSLESIGEQAFANLHLRTLSLPAGIKHIGEGALAGMKELTQLHIAEGNARYDVRQGLLFDKDTNTLLQCFNYRKGPVDVPQGTQAIGALAFSKAQEVTQVNIPASVTRIGHDAFASTYSLARIEVAADNPRYSSSAEGVLFNKDRTKLIAYPASRNGNKYEVPATVKKLAAGAFQEAGGQNTHAAAKDKAELRLKTVALPEGLEIIGHEAFLFAGVQHVNIPSTVRAIGYNCFYYTDIEEAVLPEGISRLEDCTFYACYSLRKVVLPASLEYVGRGVFDLSDGLKTIEIHAATPPRCHAEAFAKIGTNPRLEVPNGDKKPYNDDETWASLTDHKAKSQRKAFVK